MTQILSAEIERVSNYEQKACWRLVIWATEPNGGLMQIRQVAEADRINLLYPILDAEGVQSWPVRQSAAEVTRALMALGRVDVDGIRGDRSVEPKFKLKVYNNRIEAIRCDETTNWENLKLQWCGAVDGWRTPKLEKYIKPGTKGATQQTADGNKFLAAVKRVFNIDIYNTARDLYNNHGPDTAYNYVGKFFNPGIAAELIENMRAGAVMLHFAGTDTPGTADKKTMDDIQESILILLGDAKEDGTVYTVDQLVEAMQASGYPTEKAWVETVLNSLTILGKVRNAGNEVVELVL